MQMFLEGECPHEQGVLEGESPLEPPSKKEKCVYGISIITKSAQM